MKRLNYIFLVLFSILFLFSTSKITFAISTEPTVLYDGADKKIVFINTENTDLFPKFKDIIPGDVISQNINLKCENITEKTKIFLKAEIDDNIDLADDITLTVLSDGKQISNGSADDISDISSYVELGEFDKDSQIDLEVILSVPTSVGNEIMNVRKNIDYIFAVQVLGVDEKPIELPQTGDDENILFFIVLMIISFLMIIISLYEMKKNKTVKKIEN